MSELSRMDHVKLFIRGWVDDKKSPLYVWYRCPRHGLVRCKVPGYGQTFSCPLCSEDSL